MKRIIIGLAMLTATALPAVAQQHDHNGHPPEHQAIHELFYKDWMRLDSQSSCCNLQDCFPTIMVQRKGQWWALRQAEALELERRVANGENPTVPPVDNNKWIKIPDNKLEQNANRTDIPGIKFPRDPRDSPDGRSHACIIGETVYCAVVGSGL